MQFFASHVMLGIIWMAPSDISYCSYRWQLSLLRYSIFCIVSITGIIGIITIYIVIGIIAIYGIIGIFLWYHWHCYY